MTDNESNYEFESLANADTSFDETNEEKIPELNIHENLVNKFERLEHVVFERLPLKRLIDNWVSELNSPSDFDWVVQRDDDDMRLWYRKRGLDSAPDIPLVQVEYYFPEIDDPRLISIAIAHFRHKFDLVTNESVEELEQYRNGNSGVYHIVGKETIVAARDVIEKRLVFEALEATLGMNKEEAELEVGTGSRNDVYAWVSACPNEIRPE